MIVLAVVLAPASDLANAQPPGLADDYVEQRTSRPAFELHGFISEGGFWSTDNDYIGTSSRGSLELFEAALNVSSEVTDRLRAGIQLYSRDVGKFDGMTPRIDWAFLDYKWKSQLGLRAGVIKMPFGLYNEFTDIDSARVPILLPQALYSVRNREALLAHRGFAIYGALPLGRAGELDYQAWLGGLNIPDNALTLVGASLDSVDTKYVTGAQMFWHPPIEGLRVGGSFVRASIDFNVTLDPSSVAALIMAGIVPPDYAGALVVSQRPTMMVVGSAEYTYKDWLFAAEYSRSFTRQVTSLPEVIPTANDEREQFYGMATYQMSDALSAAAYYAIAHLDAHDRSGRGTRFAERFHAFQRDASLTLRYDVNEHWLWKLEGHFIDGTADVDPMTNPARYWGLFLLRTTVSF
jgi:hypothetical protein